MSGQRLAYPEKAKVVLEMKIPQTKTVLRRILGFLYVREHIPNIAEIAKPLTAKRVAAKIPWRSDQQQAFDELKRLLCKATIKPLHIVDSVNPSIFFVDTSSFAY